MTFEEDMTPDVPKDLESVPVEEATHPENNAYGYHPDDTAKGSKGPVSSDWSRDRRSSIARIMKKKKSDDRIAVGENVYSVLIVAPIASMAFVYCILVVMIKIAILCILLSDIRFGDLLEEDVKVTVVKFCLIPVAVAMQEDMMYSFYTFANVMYCPSVEKDNPCASEKRFYFSYFLRTIDGILSLFSNYFIMLITEKTLDVFLNFAALQFLYAIDDVFYELFLQGFCGDVVQQYSLSVQNLTMARRVGSDNSRLLGLRISWLDSIFFCASLLLCYIVFAIVTAAKYDDNFNAIIGTAAPTVSAIPSMMPSFAPSFAPSFSPTFSPTTFEDANITDSDFGV